MASLRIVCSPLCPVVNYSPRCEGLRTLMALANSDLQLPNLLPWLLPPGLENMEPTPASSVCPSMRPALSRLSAVEVCGVSTLGAAGASTRDAVGVVSGRGAIEPRMRATKLFRLAGLRRQATKARVRCALPVLFERGVLWCVDESAES
eukprot:1114186-Prymnesium_polylepis.1